MEALILVDIQNDFLPDGALAVPCGDEVVAVAEAMIPRFDLVVARAFSSLDLMLNLARPWVKEGGELLAMKGPDVDEELREIDPSPQKYGFALSGRERYRLPFSRAERQLLRFKRIALPEK